MNTELFRDHFSPFDAEEDYEHATSKLDTVQESGPLGLPAQHTEPHAGRITDDICDLEALYAASLVAADGCQNVPQ